MLELNYGDNYVKVDEGERKSPVIGGIFAGTWDMLEDCFGITADTIEGWCRDNGYYYSVKKFGPEDQLLNNLYNFRHQLTKVDADKLSDIINEYEQAAN